MQTLPVNRCFSRRRGSDTNVWEHGEVDRELYPRIIGFPQSESHRAAKATAAAVLPPIPAEPPKQHLPLSWRTEPLGNKDSQLAATPPFSS